MQYSIYEQHILYITNCSNNTIKDMIICEPI